MFPNKDTPCGRENECTRERSCDVLDVVDKKETAFSFVLYKILDILEGRWILQQYQTIGEIFFRFRAKTSLKKNEYHCVVQMHGLEHTQRFRWFQSNAVVQSFQFEFATHLTYIQGKHSRSIDRKYNYRECWCYIIHIKRCFPHTNQWLFLLRAVADSGEGQARAVADSGMKAGKEQGRAVADSGQGGEKTGREVFSWNHVALNSWFSLSDHPPVESIIYGGPKMPNRKMFCLNHKWKLEL